MNCSSGLETSCYIDNWDKIVNVVSVTMVFAVLFGTILLIFLILSKDERG